MNTPNSSSQLKEKKLVGQPIKVGDITLSNRMAMAPLTRMRADPQTAIPNDIMKEYYEQRTGFGLIITEGSQISPLSNAYPGSGGIYSQEQVEGWKKVTEAVHKKGGKIVLQIWHCGRGTIPEFIDGQTPLGPSPIAIRSPYALDKTKFHPVPKEMTQEDIDRIKQEYKKGAENAKEAGFDGVQLHAANGYLVDQFLRDGSNQRKDKYGGSIENRCRFMLEVLDILIEVFGSKKISVRFSPTGRENDMYDSNPIELMKYALSELSKLDLAFVEVKRHGILDDQLVDGEKLEKFKKYNEGRVPAYKQIPHFYETIRPFYNGILIANDGYDPETAQELLDKDLADMVSFGSLAIVNPDLPQRVQNEWPIETKQDPDTWFTQGPKGYTDFEPYRQ